ncbi:substrate-binding domain-containing protein [Saccharopolyspora halophila]|uniref:Substrate-binding domain-containing protein n=1 Tax=Saccharopolyspora halophila TaxID=405551 RepID=A0ABP5SK25_9PSEU
MSDVPWELILAIIGVLVPIAAFLWEFVVVGRKRLGYRVQMDTTPTRIGTNYAGAWQRLDREDGKRLTDPSFALLRVENVGSAPIDESDYASPEGEKVGLWARFPGRKVAGVVVTELSDSALEPYFVGADCGLGTHDVESETGTVGTVSLPKVKLNPRAHYKVLVVLERAGAGEFAEPDVVGTVSGGGDGKILRTKGQTGTPPTGTPRWAGALIAFLLMVGLAEPLIFELTEGEAVPLECAAGELTVVGSTAFESVLDEAVVTYENSCPEADIALQLGNSHDGLRDLNDRASAELLAFSDGEKGEQMPALVPRPMALLLFTVVINPKAGVHELSSPDLRRVFDGQVRNWQELGGRDLPVRIVDREADSGTRATFEERVLGRREPGENTGNCAAEPQGEVVRCRREGTSGLLDAVSKTPGAIGYSEVEAANDHQGVRPVLIDGQAATPDAVEEGVYPYWQTEYAYTYGVPASGSLPMSFMRYLTDQRGADIIRSHDKSPCQDLRNHVSCRPDQR